MLNRLRDLIVDGLSWPLRWHLSGCPRRRTFHWIERVVLRKIPGYMLYESVVKGFSSADRDAGFKSALVVFDDNTVRAFIIEPASAVHDMVTVFVASAPTPTSGSVVLVPSSRGRL